MITANRQAEILRGQTSCAQRVFSVVPAQSQWSTTQIHQELARIGIHRQGKNNGLAQVAY